VCGVVDDIDADVDKALVQDVAAMAVVGWLLVVHRLLDGQYARLRTVAVVGDVLPYRAPAVPGGRDPSAQRRLTTQLVAKCVGLRHRQIVSVCGINEFAVHLQRWQSMVCPFGVQLGEHRVRPVRPSGIAR
jgi:hypothetical protein